MATFRMGLREGVANPELLARLRRSVARRGARAVAEELAGEAGPHLWPWLGTSGALDAARARYHALLLRALPPGALTGGAEAELSALGPAGAGELRSRGPEDADGAKGSSVQDCPWWLDDECPTPEEETCSEDNPGPWDAPGPGSGTPEDPFRLCPICIVLTEDGAFEVPCAPEDMGDCEPW